MHRDLRANTVLHLPHDLVLGKAQLADLAACRRILAKAERIAPLQQHPRRRFFVVACQIVRACRQRQHRLLPGGKQLRFSESDHLA